MNKISIFLITLVATLLCTTGAYAGKYTCQIIHTRELSGEYNIDGSPQYTPWEPTNAIISFTPEQVNIIDGDRSETIRIVETRKSGNIYTLIGSHCEQYVDLVKICFKSNGTVVVIRDDSAWSVEYEIFSINNNLIKQYIDEVFHTHLAQSAPVGQAVTKQAEEVVSTVDQMPTFPGGDIALMKYISSHLQYPEAAIKKGIQGRVIVKFVVRKDGSVGEAQVARSVDPDLDREAVRLCKSLPKFTPGRLGGQPVNVWYTLPVTFKLSR